MRVGGKIEAVGGCNLSPGVVASTEGQASKFDGKRHSAKGSWSNEGTGRQGFVCFCSMLYSHHPRTAGTQILVGKYQEVTDIFIVDTLWSPQERTSEVLLGVDTLQELESCQGG